MLTSLDTEVYFAKYHEHHGSFNDSQLHDIGLHASFPMCTMGPSETEKRDTDPEKIMRRMQSSAARTVQLHNTTYEDIFAEMCRLQSTYQNSTPKIAVVQVTVSAMFNLYGVVLHTLPACQVCNVSPPTARKAISSMCHS